MIKFVFKNLLLVLVAFSLFASPTLTFAASKKIAKRVSASHKVASHKSASKHTASRIKVSSKSRSSKFSAKKGHVQKVSYHIRGQRKTQVVHYSPPVTVFDENYDGSGTLKLASNKVLIINQNTGETVFAKNTNSPAPIASITKLMTAMVMLDAKQPLDESLEIAEEDIDYLKSTSSRLVVGTQFTRIDMLQLALMSSENRAASSIGRHYPGGRMAFVKAMNAKAQLLGLGSTHFADPTGLDSENVSTAEDLVKMVQAAFQYPEIRNASTTAEREVYLEGREFPVTFKNTNGLVREGEWEIGLSKTGFINEAGRCLVMQAKIANEPMIIVLLDSYGKYSRIGDANRIRKWVEYNSAPKELPATITTGKLKEPMIIANNP
jgi:serine-type D-Ala-D-Ala endopeptidase (penicillin-binding protein 7)